MFPILILALIALTSPEPPPSHPPLATVELVAEGNTLEPGDSLWLAARFTIPEGWHLYWNGLNDSGLEPTFEFTVPPGFTLGNIQWPAPSRKITAGVLLDHIYEGELVLPFSITAPAQGWNGEAVTIQATVDWLICKDVCIPEQGRASLNLGSEAPPPLDPRGITNALARVPLPTPPATAEARWDGATLTLRVDGADRVAFFPHRNGALPLKLREQGAAEGPVLTLDFEPTTVSLGITGVLEVQNGQGTTWYHMSP